MLGPTLSMELRVDMHPVLRSLCFLVIMFGACCRTILGQLTAEEDRARLLGLLGLKESEMRPRPDGDARSPHATNYDLTKANVFPKLPNPLNFRDGRRVANAADWAVREEEIRADFDKEILGRTPEGLPAVKWHVLMEREETYGGVEVKTKLLSGEAGPREGSAEPIHIELLL